MKKLSFTIFVALLAFFIIQGCEKAQLTDLGVGTKIIASKTQIAQLDLDTLLFTGASVTDSVKWSVTPEGKSVIQSKGNTAVIYFLDLGNYTVSAQKASGGEVKTKSINVVPHQAPPFVSDPGTTNTTVSTSNNSDTTQYIPITGDINVSPDFYRIPSGDSVQVNFSLQTVNKYCSRGIIEYTSILDAAKNYSLDIGKIRAPKNCAGSLSPDMQVWAGYIFKRKLLGLGTHQISITYNGTTYTGTIIVNTTNIIINWNYTSGVIMLTHVING